jgi:hypothetical protein
MVLAELAPGQSITLTTLVPHWDSCPTARLTWPMPSGVFTHIPIHGQETWVAEMHRVVRPGGFFLVTVMGRCFKQFLPLHRREDLERRGELEIPSSDQDAHI